MEQINIWQKGKMIVLGLAFLIAAFVVASVTEVAWYNMVVKIREAITSGDTGFLILASASNNIITMLQNTLVAIGIIILVGELGDRFGPWIIATVLLFSFSLINWLIAELTLLPWEPITNLTSLSVIIILASQFKKTEEGIYRWMILSLIVFFAFQWLNIMPNLTRFYFGITDIPNSIKLASIYMDSIQVLNFIGLAFFIPLILTALITTGLFLSNDQNILMIHENFENQKALDAIRSKVLENRIYEEIHSLTHDLKTPLVTIRGLNSLLSLSKDMSKVELYTERIDGAIEKMSEMISSFLYESSRQQLTVSEISGYVRAQIPIEDESLEIIVNQQEDLPTITVNKVRIVRAIINLIENAIVVKTDYDHKIIEIKFSGDPRELNIAITDNGIGIENDVLEKIWDMGYSTNNTSGMGMAFAKKVIEDHMGHIAIKSQLGEGTTVTITLPSSDCVEEAL